MGVAETDRRPGIDLGPCCRDLSALAPGLWTPQILRPLWQLVSRWAWPRQYGAEVSIENIIMTDSGSVQLENAPGHCPNQVQVTTSSQPAISTFATSRRSILFLGERDYSIPDCGAFWGAIQTIHICVGMAPWLIRLGA